MEGNARFEDFYIKAILDADIVAETAVPGCQVLKPYGYLIWERIRVLMDEELSRLGYEKAYFPMMIPHSLFSRQKEFCRAFSREAVWADAAGGERLPERYALRPSSEPVVLPAVKGWIRTRQDLPLKIVQWCNIVRWEILKKPFPLIRSNEFLWHECYSFHADKRECDDATRTIYEVYHDLMARHLALPVFTGKKPDRRKFPAADYTLALEAMARNGKGVQAATSHSLGKNYSKPFGLQVRVGGRKTLVHVSCAGLTTRLIGIVAMVHHDRKGIILPPKIAPYELAMIGKRQPGLEGSFRCVYGKTKSYWIAHGVPLILEGQSLTRRDTLGVVRLARHPQEQIRALLEDITSNLVQQAARFQESHTFEVRDYSMMCDIIRNQKGFCLAAWCGSDACTHAIKKDSNGSLRVINPLDSKMSCIACKKKAKYLGVFGQSY